MLSLEMQSERLGEKPRKMVNGPYYCPKCSKNKLQIMVDQKNKEVIAVCLECGVKQNLSFAPVFEPVDYYNKFVDHLKKEQSG